MVFNFKAIAQYEINGQVEAENVSEAEQLILNMSVDKIEDVDKFDDMTQINEIISIK